jgi:hypothetical protein
MKTKTNNKSNDKIVLARDEERTVSEEFTLETLKKVNEFFSEGITYSFSYKKILLNGVDEVKRKDNLITILEDLTSIKNDLILLKADYGERKKKEEERERKRFHWDFLTLTPFAFGRRMRHHLQSPSTEEEED